MRQVLLTAWREWDERPGEPARARRLVAACHAYAGEHSLRLREHMSEARRAGLSYELAIEEWELLNGDA